MQSKKKIGQVGFSDRSIATCAVFSPDGKKIAAISRQGKLMVIGSDFDRWHYAMDLPYSYEDDQLLAFSPDGQWVIVKSGAGSLMLLNAQTGENHFSIVLDKQTFSTAAFSPNGGFLAIGGAGLGARASAYFGQSG